MRWFPFPLPKEESVDFVNGLKTICGAGDVFTRNGLAVYVYACNISMTNKAFYSADGDFLIGRFKEQWRNLKWTLVYLLPIVSSRPDFIHKIDGLTLNAPACLEATGNRYNALLMYPWIIIEFILCALKISSSRRSAQHFHGVWENGRFTRWNLCYSGKGIIRTVEIHEFYNLRLIIHSDELCNAWGIGTCVCAFRWLLPLLPVLNPLLFLLPS